MPIRVDKANKIKIVAEPSSKSNQLIKGNDYTIKINIFTKEDRPIYPSEVIILISDYLSLYISKNTKWVCSLKKRFNIFQNILCKTTFPRNLEVKEISENGLEAKVTAKSNGLGKVSVIYNKKRQIKIEFQFEILGKVHIFMRRPQNFAKSSPYFLLQYIQSKVRWKFFKIMWPSQNIWTLSES